MFERLIVSFQRFGNAYFLRLVLYIEFNIKTILDR
jgi:hypothetical protein